MTSNLTKKILVEFIGTFILCIIICFVVINKIEGLYGSFIVSLTLMILIYCGKSISGAHYNPAVTISIYYRGYCSKRELQYYVFFQLIGSVTASILYYYLIIPVNANYEIFELNMSALISEFIFTFLLVSVILNVATLDATEGNYYFGFAIAFVVFLGGILVGDISLASFNPAVTSALILSGKINLLDSWIHIIPQLLSALLATFLFKFYHKIN